MIQKIATVTLWVDDFEKAIHFYRDILGLEMPTQPGEIPHFRVGEGMLVLVKGFPCQPEGAFPPEFPHVTFEVSDLDQSVEKLQAQGITFESGIESRRDSRWIKLCDPAGNLIELLEICQPAA